MDGTTTAGGSLPPETTIVPPPPRGHKRGAPDDDEAAGAGGDRGSPRRAAGVGAVVEEEEELSMESAEEEEELSMESAEEEEEDDEEELDEAPPARQLIDFLQVSPCADADDGATAAGQEPVDVTLRLGGTVDTTLRLRLGEDDGGFRSHGEPPVVGAMPQGAASNAEPDFDDHGFLTVNDAAGSGRRPSSVLDLNKPCPSEFPDGAPGTSRVPDPAPVDVDERSAAAAMEQRHRSRAPFIDFFRRSPQPCKDVRAPGVLTADSS